MTNKCISGSYVWNEYMQLSVSVHIIVYNRVCICVHMCYLYVYINIHTLHI